MENDSIRSSGSDTVVDIWIDGKIRAICVSQEAIGAFLGFDRASGLSDDDRCDFVRTHLPAVLAAAKNRLRETDPAADSILVDAGHLPRSDGRPGERRTGDRRKGERRKSDQPKRGVLERRRTDRRQGERRTRAPKPKPE